MLVLCESNWKVYVIYKKIVRYCVKEVVVGERYAVATNFALINVFLNGA